MGDDSTAKKCVGYVFEDWIPGYVGPYSDRQSPGKVLEL